MEKDLLHSKKMTLLLLPLFLLSFLITSHTAFGQLQLHFSSPTVYGSDGQPSDIAIADFTGDTKPDIVTMNLQGGDLVLFVNTGFLTFAPQKPVISIADPMAITAGDYNGDGNQDIAVSDFNGTVRIFLGNGDGSFTPGNIPITGEFYLPHAFYLNTADFNNDHKPDISICTGDNTHILLLGNGDGTFTNAGTVLTGGFNAASTVADFNGDGMPDVAAIYYDHAILSVLINTGNGSFAPVVTYPVGLLPYKIITGDFNGDGKVDIATGSNTKNISILFNNGDGTFKPAVNMPITPFVFTTADYNHDGIADIVTGGSDGPLVALLGSKSGVFTNAASFPGGGDGYGAAKSVDLNGDLMTDLVITNADNNSISVIYNLSQPCPKPVITANGPTTFCSGDSVTLSAPASTSYLWSNGATSQSIIVKSAGGYAVTTTAADGCNNLNSDTTFVKVNLCDSDGDGIPDSLDCDPQDAKHNKVMMCHNGFTICVNKNAVDAHLKHGDHLGKCNPGCPTGNDTRPFAKTLDVFPNPNNGFFIVVLNNAVAGKGELQILDVKGAIIEKRNIHLEKGRQIYPFNLSKKPGGVYLVKLINGTCVQTVKMIIQHH